MQQVISSRREVNIANVSIAAKQVLRNWRQMSSEWKRIPIDHDFTFRKLFLCYLIISAKAYSVSLILQVKWQIQGRAEKTHVSQTANTRRRMGLLTLSGRWQTGQTMQFQSFSHFGTLECRASCVLGRVYL